MLACSSFLCLDVFVLPTDLLARRFVEKVRLFLLMLLACLQILMSAGLKETPGNGRSKYLRCCRRLLGGRDYQLA
jgi:hypothetical protein